MGFLDRFKKPSPELVTPPTPDRAGDEDDDKTPVLARVDVPEEKIPLVTTHTTLVVDPVPPNFGVPAPTPSPEEGWESKYLKLRSEHDLNVSKFDAFCSHVLRLMPEEVHTMVAEGKSIPEAVEEFIKSRS
jgi:hypothetical protein